jgi:hypothetical protein
LGRAGGDGHADPLQAYVEVPQQLNLKHKPLPRRAPRTWARASHPAYA